MEPREICIRKADQCRCGGYGDLSCASCGHTLCEEHSVTCDCCLKPNCRKCLTLIEDLLICAADVPVFMEEMARVRETDTAREAIAKLAEIAVDLRRCQVELESDELPDHKLGFIGSAIDRWIGRLSA